MHEANSFGVLLYSRITCVWIESSTVLMLTYDHGKVEQSFVSKQEPQLSCKFFIGSELPCEEQIGKE